MGDNFRVGEPHGDLDDQTRHAIVAAQLRGEEKASGREPQAVIEAVAQELRAIGVEPDEEELRRRYAAIDPDLPVVEDGQGAEGDAPGAEPVDGAGEAALPADHPRGVDPEAEVRRQRNLAAGDHHDPV